MNDYKTLDKQTEALREQLKLQEKLSSLGMLTAGIAHEIKNPLNFIINFSKVAESLLEDLKISLEKVSGGMGTEEKENMQDIRLSLEEALHKITGHGNHALDIVQSILLYSRGREDGYVPTDTVRLTREYVWLAYHAMRANYKNFNMAVSENYEEAMPEVRLIPQDFCRVVLNVMNNACYAVWRKSQKITEEYAPAVRIALYRKEGCLVLEIEDNGEGMDAETKQKLYDAFYTTKPAGHGTGLGMTIVKEIVVQKHHGNISFASEAGKYTCFTIRIPLNL